ncbi:hypothetical protein COOONC_03993 [Cooperia oncophora]
MRTIWDCLLRIAQECRRSLYLSKNIAPPDMSVKKGYIYIGKNLSMKSALAVVKLGISLPDWKGIPVEELLSDHERAMLVNGERKPECCMKLPQLECVTETDMVFDNCEDSTQLSNDVKQHLNSAGINSRVEKFSEPRGYRSIGIRDLSSGASLYVLLIAEF